MVSAKTITKTTQLENPDLIGNGAARNSAVERVDLLVCSYLCPMNEGLHRLTRLLKLYWILEGRSMQLLTGVTLYVVAILMVCSYLFRNPDGQVWLAIYWMIMLFAAVNIGVLSYMQESGARRWYYYQLSAGNTVFGAKAIHIFNILCGISVITLALMNLILGWPLHQLKPLIISGLLANASLGILFSFLSALVSQSRSNTLLTTIISFPLVIGIVLLAGKISSAGLMPSVQLADLREDITMLSGLVMVMAGIGMVLFRYIWRD